MTIIPTGAILPATQPFLPARHQAAAESDFSVPMGPASASEGRSVQPPGAAPVSGAGAMLALQEQSGQVCDRSADVADREARRHGREMLEALAALQRALLAEIDPQRSLLQLSALAEDAPLAHDPALAGILSAIRLRARLEILRRTPISPQAAGAHGPLSTAVP